MTLTVYHSTGNPRYMVDLIGCLPVYWSSILTPNYSTHDGSGQTVGLIMSVTRIEISHPTRRDIDEWLAGMIDGSSVYRMVGVTHIAPDGSDLQTINYQECFIIGYQFPRFNADEQDVELVERVIIKPRYSDNALD